MEVVSYINSKGTRLDIEDYTPTKKELEQLVQNLKKYLDIEPSQEYRDSVYNSIKFYRIRQNGRVVGSMSFSDDDTASTWDLVQLGHAEKLVFLTYIIYRYSHIYMVPHKNEAKHFKSLVSIYQWANYLKLGRIKISARYLINKYKINDHSTEDRLGYKEI